MDKPSYLNGLNDLQDLLVDSRKGYAEAAERAEDPGIKSLLSNFSEGRRGLIDALASERRVLDKDYKPSDGTLKGDAHRAWMDVRDALSSSENANVLSECERGENYLLDRFKEVLEQSELPGGLRALLSEEQNRVRANVDTVRSLRHERERVE